MDDVKVKNERIELYYPGPRLGEATSDKARSPVSKVDKHDEKTT